MTQGTIIPPAVDQDSIEYGHVYANYVKSVADTPGDPDADPDIVHVNGQVTFDSTFPGASARGSIRLPASPRAYGLIVTGDTFEIINSKLVDHEGREGVRLIASVDGIPLSWQAVVTLQDSAGRTIYNKSYIIHHDLWDSSGELLHINLPDLIPTPSRLEPPEGAAVRAAEKALEEIRALTGSNEQINLDIEGLKSEVIVLHGETGQRLTAAEAARAAAVTAQGLAEAAQSASETARSQAQTARTGAQTARTGAETARDEAEGHASDASGSASAAAGSASAASSSASAAAGSASDASGSASAAAGSASDASSSASAAAGSASAASSSASAAAGSAQDAAGSAQDAAGSASDASSSASGAESARDAAAGSASDAAGSATAAARSASDADESKVQAQFARTGAETARDLAADHRQVASSASTTAQNARGQAQTAASTASGHASAAATSAGNAEDDRVLAEDAASEAGGHAQAADGHRVDAEAAAALAQSLRWVVRGAWEPGQYEAGDVVVWDERAYYAQTGTSAQPPAQPWVPLTPAGGGASHWDDLDGKPVVFPPEAHTHDAEDVSGAATPLLDVTEASVGAQSVSEALDATTDASRLEGALTDQVDASAAIVNYAHPADGAPVLTTVEGLARESAAAMAAMIDLWGMVEDKPDVGHTHDGADITGALTDQVDASAAMVTYESPIHGDATVPIAGLLRNWSSVVEVFPSFLQAFEDALESKSDVGHTHDGADITGALTSAVDASEAIVQVGSGQGSLESNLAWIQQEISGKSDKGHTHTVAEVDGLQAALDDAAASGSSAEVMTRSEFDQITPDPEVWYVILRDA